MINEELKDHDQLLVQFTEKIADLKSIYDVIYN